ncbi:MAG: thiamine-phosphate kinase [Pseudomonadota bacterium]
MDEFSRIARYFAPLAGPEGLGLLDDAALMAALPGEDLVLAKDVAIAGVHFPIGCVPAVAARRSLRPNLSDLAAMGARPLGYLLGLSLPAALDERWIAGFAAALWEDQQAYGLSLWGGDSVKAPHDLSISITIIGAIAKGAALRRSGARAGDDIYVSGVIGAAAAGLAQALGKAPVRERWLDAYEAPTPRLDLGRALVGLASAAIDVSDGLVADVGHLAQASRCAAALQLADVPIPSGLPLSPEDAITAGDDYELAFTAAPSVRSAIFTLSESLGLTLSRIGVMRAASKDGSPVVVLKPDGSELLLSRTGWQHA